MRTLTSATCAYRGACAAGVAPTQPQIPWLAGDLRPENSDESLRDIGLAIAALSAFALGASARQAQMTTTWTFDRLENIGGHSTTVLGQPRVIDSPVGKAVEFDGKDDALFIDNHPLAGADAFTWEAIFRPDGGEKEQRWFHLSERDPVTGADTENRMLFEIRVVDDKWFFDSYNQSGAANKALINRHGIASSRFLVPRRGRVRRQGIQQLR